MCSYQQVGPRVCRVCESNEKLHDITSTKFKHLKEKFCKVYNYEDADCNYLKYLCGDCSYRLRISFDFIIQCQETHKKLIINKLNKTVNKNVDKTLEERQNLVQLCQDKIDEIEMDDNEQTYNECDLKDNLMTEDTTNAQATINLKDNIECDVSDDQEKSYLELFESVDDSEDETKLNENSSIKLDLLPEIKEYIKKRESGVFEKYKCKLNEPKENTDKLTKTNKPRKRKMCICKYCGKVYTSQGTMDQHIYVKHLKLNYKCALCGKEYSHKHNLRYHMLIKHQNKKPHKCKICNEEFKYYPELIKHRKDNVSCAPNEAVLDRRIHQKTHLLGGEVQEHQESNTIKQQSKNKLYLCDICGYAITKKQALQRHMLTHSSEFAYACDQCDKKFKQPVGLSSHKKLHNEIKPFVCDMCPRSFTYKTNLVQHIYTHTGERQHHCEICGKGFRYKQLVRAHMRVHTGEKAHKCSICSKMFATERTMKKHKARCTLGPANDAKTV